MILKERHKSILLSLFLQFSDYQDSYTRLKVKDFGTKSTITGVNFSKETLFDEFQRVVTLKVEFESGEKSKLIASFGIFGLSKFWTREQRLVLQENTPAYFLEVSTETLVEIKPVKTGKEVWIPGWIKTITTFTNLQTVKRLNQGLEQFVFEKNPPSQVWSSPLRPWWKKSNL